MSQILYESTNDSFCSLFLYLVVDTSVFPIFFSISFYVSEYIAIKFKI